PALLPAGGGWRQGGAPPPPAASCGADQHEGTSPPEAQPHTTRGVSSKKMDWRHDMAGKGFRTEHDSMGELQVPADALWGASTQRAVENFPVSGRPMPRGFIRALGLVKAAAADANAGF